MQNILPKSGPQQHQMNISLHTSCCLTHMSLDERLGQQPLRQLLEAGLLEGEEDPRDGDVVPRQRLACRLPTAEHRQCPWNVPHWHLVALVVDIVSTCIDTLHCLTILIKG